MKLRLAIALAAALIAASCSDDVPAATRSTVTWPSAPSTTTSTAVTSTTTTPVTSSTSAAVTPTTEAPPNEVVIGVDLWPESLNPYLDWTETGDRIAQALHRGLTEIDGETLQVVPDLALRVPTVENGLVVMEPGGGATVTFELDPDAVWADGRAITGDDVVFTYEAIMSLEDVPSFDRSAYEAIVGISGSADRVSMTFSEPTFAFETIFPVVLPAHQMEGTDFSSDWNDEPWMSAGPFRVGWLEFDEFVFVPNEAYPREGAHLDRLVFRYVPDGSELLGAFGRGEVDLILPGPNPDAVRRFGGAEGVDVAVGAGQIWEHLTFQFGDRNRNPESLNAELDFRRAVAAALDVGALVDGFWLADEAFTGLLDMAGLSSDEPWSGREPDLDEARALLDSLCERLGRDCVEDPPRVVVSSTSNGEARPVIAQRIRDQLAEVGIEVLVELEDSAIFFASTMESGTFDLGLWAWITGAGRSAALATLEAFDPASPRLGDVTDPSTLSGANPGRWGTPAVTGQIVVDLGYAGVVDLNQGPSSVIDEHTARYAEILAEMRITVDRDRFDELAREAEAILADQVVLIPLVARGHVSVTRGISGYTPTRAIDTWNVEEWRRG